MSILNQMDSTCCWMQGLMCGERTGESKKLVEHHRVGLYWRQICVNFFIMDLHDCW